MTIVVAKTVFPSQTAVALLNDPRRFSGQRVQRKQRSLPKMREKIVFNPFVNQQGGSQ